MRSLMVGNALKNNFANNFMFIKYIFSQATFLFTFLDGWVLIKGST